MRIQDTDRVLKEARFSRRNNAVEKGGSISRAWIAVIVAIIAVAGGLFAWMSRESRE